MRGRMSARDATYLAIQTRQAAQPGSVPGGSRPSLQSKGLAKPLQKKWPSKLTPRKLQPHLRLIAVEAQWIPVPTVQVDLARAGLCELASRVLVVVDSGYLVKAGLAEDVLEVLHMRAEAGDPEALVGEVLVLALDSWVKGQYRPIVGVRVVAYRQLARQDTGGSR